MGTNYYDYSILSQNAGPSRVIWINPVNTE
jgi:hypothetical protein